MTNLTTYNIATSPAFNGLCRCICLPPISGAPRAICQGKNTSFADLFPVFFVTHRNRNPLPYSTQFSIHRHPSKLRSRSPSPSFLRYGCLEQRSHSSPHQSLLPFIQLCYFFTEPVFSCYWFKWGCYLSQCYNQRWSEFCQSQDKRWRLASSPTRSGMRERSSGVKYLPEVAYPRHRSIMNGGVLLSPNFYRSWLFEVIYGGEYFGERVG